MVLIQSGKMNYKDDPTFGLRGLENNLVPVIRSIRRKEQEATIARALWHLLGVMAQLVSATLFHIVSIPFTRKTNRNG